MKEVISKLDMMQKTNEVNFKLLLWVVSIAFAVIAVAVAIVALK